MALDLKEGVKKYINYNGLDADIDPFIVTQTVAALQYFSHMIGQNLSAETQDYVITDLCYSRVYLPFSINPVLNSITTYPRFSSTGTVVDSDDYENNTVYKRPYIILRSLLLDTKYVFNITSGYGDTAFPDTIETIMIEYIVLKLYESNYMGSGKSRLALSTIITDMTDGLKTIETVKDMRADWIQRLSEYMILDP